MISQLITFAKQFPEYWPALLAAASILFTAIPIYAGVYYFMHRRRITAPWSLPISFLGVFVLFSILAFLYASPLAQKLPSLALTLYLAITCISAAWAIVKLIDVFLVQHYLGTVHHVYVSPPMRNGLNALLFCLALLPILYYVLHFNPLALVAIPTIATAGLALALQDTLKSFIAGVGLGQIIRLGDWIRFQDKEGRVTDINWTRTVLQNGDGHTVYIPNSMLQTGHFTNCRSVNPAAVARVQVRVSYDVSPSRVKELMLQAVQGVEGVNTSAVPHITMVEFGDSAVIYALLFSTLDTTRRLKVQDEVSARIWYAFKRENIAVPYPVRTLRKAGMGDAKALVSARAEEALQRWKLAEAFYAEELRELSQWTGTRLYASGETVVKAGDPGQSLFVITEGTVDVLATENPKRLIATLGPGDIFGEMSLLTGALRSATIQATSALEILEIQRAGMQNVLARRPDLTERLAELMVKRQTALASAGSPTTENDQGTDSDPSDSTTLAQKIRLFFGLA